MENYKSETESKLEEVYRSYLETLPLTTLRQLGRVRGVSPAIRMGNKPHLINGIVDMLTGKTKPIPSSGRGAPVKLSYLDPTVQPRLEQIRKSVLGDRGEMENRPMDDGGETEVRGYDLASPEAVPNFYNEELHTGILEVMPSGYGFLRARNCQPTNGEDVFIAAPQIHNWKLREGDFITCTVKPRVKDSSAIDEIRSVNGLPAGSYEQRAFSDSLTACYPSEKIEQVEKAQR